jgi:hypothetical protein
LPVAMRFGRQAVADVCQAFRRRVP